jgi:hypothetical protein
VHCDFAGVLQAILGFCSSNRQQKLGQLSLQVSLTCTRGADLHVSVASALLASWLSAGGVLQSELSAAAGAVVITGRPTRSDNSTWPREVNLALCDCVIISVDPWSQSGICGPAT